MSHVCLVHPPDFYNAGTLWLGGRLWSIDVMHGWEDVELDSSREIGIFLRDFRAKLATKDMY